MKAAKAKEAASLPKQPAPAHGRAVPDLEKGEGQGAAEQQALLQVGCIHIFAKPSFAAFVDVVMTAELLSNPGIIPNPDLCSWCSHCQQSRRRRGVYICCAVSALHTWHRLDCEPHDITVQQAMVA